MSSTETAAQSFIILAKITRLLDEGHQSGREVDYSISFANNGYDIHITIVPPQPFNYQSEEPIQIST